MCKYFFHIAFKNKLSERCKLEIASSMSSVCCYCSNPVTLSL